jgi:hypothetical protein
MKFYYSKSVQIGYRSNPAGRLSRHFFVHLSDFSAEFRVRKTCLITEVCDIFLSQSFPLLPTCSQQVSRVLFSLDYTQTHTTVGRTPLDEGSARRRDLYLTTRTLYNRQTSMPPVGFEPTIPARARPQTYALDRADSSISVQKCIDL